MKRRGMISIGLAAVLALSPLFSTAASAGGGPRYGGNHYSGGGYYRGGRGFRGGGGYRGGYRHRGHGGGYALLGFGLGLLLTDAIISTRRDRNYARQQAQPYRYDPPPAARSQSYEPQDEFAGANCLQVREYQTLVIIGGEEQEAYGNACLQPDGSWLQGAYKIAPGFE